MWGGLMLSWDRYVGSNVIMGQVCGGGGGG